MKSWYFFHSLLNKASPSVLCFQLHLFWCNQRVDDTAHDLLLQNSIPDFSISLLMISSFHLSSPNLISSQITTIELKVQAGTFLLTTNMIMYTNWLSLGSFSLFWGYFAASKRWKQWNFNTCFHFLLHSKAGWWWSSSSCSLSSYLTYKCVGDVWWKTAFFFLFPSLFVNSLCVVCCCCHHQDQPPSLVFWK